MFQFVMQVPDRVRDDGSGIQKLKYLQNHWIQGQARNDKSRICVGLTIVSQSPLRESREGGIKMVYLIARIVAFHSPLLEEFFLFQLAVATPYFLP
jgi:hypothetical protein